MKATEITSARASVSPQAQPQTSLRSVALVTGLTVCQLLLQLATQLLLAKYFGAAAEMDAYVAAVAPPSVIGLILASSLGYVLVPMVAQIRATGNEREAAAVVSQVGLWLIVLSVVITFAVALASASLVAFLCPGFSAEEQQLTASLLRICAPLIVFNTLITYLNAVSHAYSRFAMPALMGVVGTLATLAYVMALHERQGIFAVAWSGIVGAVITTVLLLPLWVEKLWQAGGTSLIFQPRVQRCVQLLLPLVAASLFWRLDPLLDRYLGSQLATGSLSQMGYASRLMGALSMIGTSGLSIVAFRAIAAHASAARWTELNAELAYAMRFFLVLMIPMCAGLAIYARPVVRLLFEHGRFQAADTAAVSLLMALYVGAILGAGLGDLLSRTFYAQHDTLTPVVVCAIVFALSAALKFVLAPNYGAAGLVAATSAYYLLNTGVLTAILVSRLSPAMLMGIPAAAMRAIVSSALACLAASFVIRLPMPAAVLPAAASGAIVYLAVMWLLGDEFARKLTWRLPGSSVSA